MDKILGCLVGCGLGDALGAPFELEEKITLNDFDGKLKFKAFSRNCFTDKTRFDEIGQITDDTEMTLILARHLAEYKTINRDALILSYVEWANSSPHIGINSRIILKNAKTVEDVNMRRMVISPKNESNGALMRCSILALIDIETAINDCIITNPNQVCISVNRIYLSVIKMIIDGKNKQDIREFLHEESEKYKSVYPNICIAINQALNSESRNVRGNTKGWCVHGLYCALYGLLNFENFKTAIEYIIRLGGDTDTNGAICGALLGWYYGFNQLQNEENENIHVLLECRPKDRDIKYTFHDVFDLASKLCDK